MSERQVKNNGLPGRRSSAFVDVADTVWDAIVVGTGIGGATLGFALAKAGKRVLFLERGVDPNRSASAIKAEYPEQLGRHKGAVLCTDSDRLLADAGRYQDALNDISAPRERRFVPFIGGGSGGSSALYGMALERLSRVDFEPELAGTRNSESPTPWPVSYDTFCSHYTAAESLYRVRGTADPLGDAQCRPRYPFESPPLTKAAAKLFDSFASQGLHPYPLPLACEFVPNCQCCQGFLCALGCKNDSERICLRPAVRDFGAVLINDCQVLRVEADSSRATGLVCKIADEIKTIRGNQIFLAAGALQTPNILLRSSSKYWPEGLANSSGLVGRNLMRHCVDLYIIRAEADDLQQGFDNRFKEFAFNDFYSADGVKLGSVQSFGRLPPATMLFGSLQDDLRASPVPWLSGAAGLAKPLLMPTLRRMVDRSITLATIMEDMPYPENRVTPGEDSKPGSVRISYRLRARDLARVAKFRGLMQNALKSRRWRLVKQAENNQRLAHACGTCRFGDDPKTSVLDRNNRCHDLENLHIVDGSFFPSSGGTNPSLTIAANALRVAEQFT